MSFCPENHAHFCQEIVGPKVPANKISRNGSGNSCLTKIVNVIESDKCY